MTDALRTRFKLNHQLSYILTPSSRAVLAILAGVGLLTWSLDSTLAQDTKSSPTGKVLVDTGFRPQPSGFAFENWGGDQYPLSNLTPDDARALFGDRVCARFEKGSCVPTPAAKLWVNEMNQMMQGGRCEGMAALSAAFHIKKESVADYGAPQPFALQPQKADLLRTISTYFATQALEPVSSATSQTRSWPLQKIVDQLIAGLGSKTDYITLGIYGPNGGHAITPYMIEQLPTGVYRVHVYDNNYPGTAKYVDVDAAKDRWVYAGAALNPKEDPAPWEGGQGSMDITSLSTRYEPLQCPFCGGHKPPKQPQQPTTPASPRKPAIESDGYTIVTPARCSQVQATRKSDKKQLSGAKKSAKNEITGATMTPLRGARGCVVRLPKDQQYDVALVNEDGVASAIQTALTIFYPGSVYSVSNIALSDKTNQTFSLNKDNFAYVAGGSQKPTVRIAGDRDGTNTLYEVSGFTLHDGKSLSATEDAEGRITLRDDDAELDTCDISAEVVSESGTESHDLDDVDFGEKGQLILHAEDDGELDVDIDSDSDGIPDDSDTDDDNDGIPDAKDTDDDNDGVPDTAEEKDSDGDSIPDSKDSDDDNDGEPDTSDTSRTGGGAAADDDEQDADQDDKDTDAADPDGGDESDDSEKAPAAAAGTDESADDNDEQVAEGHDGDDGHDGDEADQGAGDDDTGDDSDDAPSASDSDEEDSEVDDSSGDDDDASGDDDESGDDDSDE